MNGGPGIGGGVATALAEVWRLRRAGTDIRTFVGAMPSARLVAQATGRIGGYFNEELYRKG